MHKCSKVYKARRGFILKHFSLEFQAAILDPKPWRLGQPSLIPHYENKANLSRDSPVKTRHC